MGKLKRLTPKERKFVCEYLIDLNATQTAIRSGYSEKSAREIASRLLSKVNIQSAIQKQREKLEKSSEISATRVLKELAIIALADMKDYVEILEGGEVQLKPFDTMPEGASRAVKSVKEKKKIMANNQGKGDESIIDCQVEYTHHDKVKALELLGKHLGIFPDKVEVGGHSGEPIKFTVVYEKDNGSQDKT
jgi:phage terminase small subunit